MQKPNRTLLEKNMNKPKFIYLIIVALALLTASNAISQTKFSIKTTSPQEALDYVNLQYIHMPLLSKAWEQYLTSRTGIRISEYGDVITALYSDLSLSYEAYNACLRQDTAQSKKTSDIWLKDLQNYVSQADIIGSPSCLLKNKEVRQSKSHDIS
jgi:hypothetical protein